MNTTLRAICQILKQEDTELQIAAIRVLGAVGSRESGVYRTMGELLVETHSPEVFRALLDAMEANPHEQSLKFLLNVLERDPEHEEQILGAIAGIGGKAVSLLRRQFERVTSQTRCSLARLLPRIRTEQAHVLLIDCFFHEDHDLVRDAVHALREEIEEYGPRERDDLLTRLRGALKDRRLKENTAALSALLIALGILADARAKPILLRYTDSQHPEQVRRHALMSLARLDFSGEKHQDVFETIHPIFDETDWEGLVRHAVAVLEGVKPVRAQGARLQELLQNRHPGVQAYAVSALGHLNSITHAEKVLPFLHNPDMHLREAAREALSSMPAAAKVILRHLDHAKGAEAHEMVSILESHANRIHEKEAKEMFRRMLELYEAGDEHHKLYCTALMHLRGDVLQKELVAVSNKAWQKKDFEKVRDTLRLLSNTPLLTPEIRYRLAMAKLKTSRKELGRSFRLSDFCLEHIAILLREDPKGFRKKFLSEKNLDPEDYLYVGYHFSERLNAERRFGADVLRHITKRGARGKAAQIARKKLKVEGH